MPVTNAQSSPGSIVSVANNQTKKGMVLPFQTLSLAFNQINYYVDMPEVSFSFEGLIFTTSFDIYLNAYRTFGLIFS